MTKHEFTPEQIARGREVTAYYESLDESDPAHQPTDDETKRPSPLNRMRRFDFVEPLSSQEREEITRIGEQYEITYVKPKGGVDNG